MCRPSRSMAASRTDTASSPKAAHTCRHANRHLRASVLLYVNKQTLRASVCEQRNRRLRVSVSEHTNRHLRAFAGEQTDICVLLQVNKQTFTCLNNLNEHDPAYTKKWLRLVHTKSAITHSKEIPSVYSLYSSFCLIVTVLFDGARPNTVSELTARTKQQCY